MTAGHPIEIGFCTLAVNLVGNAFDLASIVKLTTSAASRHRYRAKFERIKSLKETIMRKWFKHPKSIVLALIAGSVFPAAVSLASESESCSDAFKTYCECVTDNHSNVHLYLYSINLGSGAVKQLKSIQWFYFHSGNAMGKCLAAVSTHPLCR
jgi:hypothetical protein